MHHAVGDGQRCGIGETDLPRLGLRLYKPGLIWPMDRERLVDFAQGHAAVLVVEEKRPVMEDQVARHLYAIGAERRPALAGKQDLNGAPLLPAAGELTVPQARKAIHTLLEQLGIRDAHVETHYQGHLAIETRPLTTGGAARPAYFCSGCPHNTSTKLPDGSFALGGIGCHGLAAVVMDRKTMQFMPMGHEGSPWAAVGPLVDTKHVFQNMGDGTYSHSGVLAIRAAVTAKANMTYKVLYNDAVAMTGGQPVEQQITPLDLFPSGVLSNIAVQKAYTADRPGSFGSGQVQLSTTGLPTATVRGANAFMRKPLGMDRLVEAAAAIGKAAGRASPATALSAPRTRPI